MPPAGKGVRPAPLAPRKPMPGKAPGAAPKAGRVPPPPPPPLRPAAGKTPPPAAKPRQKPVTGLFPTAPAEKDRQAAAANRTDSAAGKTKDGGSALKDFAARLRAQREAAERLIARRGSAAASSSEAQREPEAPAAPPAAPSAPGKAASAAAGKTFIAPNPAAAETFPQEAPQPAHEAPATPPDAMDAGAAPASPVSAADMPAAGQGAEADAPAPGKAAEGASEAVASVASAAPGDEVAEAQPGGGGIAAGAPGDARPGAPVDELFEHAPAPVRSAGDYADVYADLEQIEAPQQRTPWIALLLAFVLIAIAAAAAVYFFLRSGGLSGGGSPANGNVPVIQGPQEPAKAPPTEAAPTPRKPQGRKLIYDRIIDEEGPAGATPPAVNKPTESAPEPVAPPPLPPPPSLGDDQGKAKPSAPSPGGGGPEHEGVEQRTAAGAPSSQLPIDVSPAGGGKEVSEDGGTAGTAAGTDGARLAAQSELTEVIRRFASVPGSNGAASSPATGDRGTDTGMAVAGTAARNDTGGSGGTAASSGATERIVTRRAPEKGLVRPKPREAARKKAASLRQRKAPERTRLAKARENVARVPDRQARRRKPQRQEQRMRQAVAGVQPALPQPVMARGAGGPIPLPGAIPPTGAAAASVAGAVQPAPPAPVRPTTTTPRKRTNFKTVKLLGGSNAVAPAAIPKPQPILPPRHDLEQPRRVAALAPASRAAATPAAPATAVRTPANRKGYVVQLAAFRSQQDALRAWQRIRARHGGIIGNMQPIISKTNLGDAGTFYRLSIGTLPSRQAASRLCQRLIARGEPDCLIRKR